MTSLLLTDIGELLTNDPSHDRPLRDAALVIEGERIAWVGAAAEAPDADEQIDAGGHAVIPGFVDSHSHLVFAGDRAEEFAARMAGESYAAGGIRTTVAATRAATDEQLTVHVAGLVAEMRRQGTTTVEIKSGYGLSVVDEARSLAVELVSPDGRVVHLGDHGGGVVPVPTGSSVPALLRLLASGKLEVSGLVSHRFAWEDALEAYLMAGDPAAEALKVVLVAPAWARHPVA